MLAIVGITPTGLGEWQRFFFCLQRLCGDFYCYHSVRDEGLLDFNLVKIWAGSIIQLSLITIQVPIYNAKSQQKHAANHCL